MIRDQQTMIDDPNTCMVSYWRYYGVDEICECNKCMKKYGVCE